MQHDRFGIGFILIIGFFSNLILSYATHNASTNQEEFARLCGGGLAMGLVAAIANHFYPRYGATTVFVLYVIVILYK